MNDLRSAVLAVALAGPSLALADGCGSLERAEWLLGHWTGERGVTESWKQAGDRTYEGHGFDGKSSESLRLVEMSGEVFYIAKVAHNELPVAFKLAICGDDLLVFENPAHDFPRRIEYRRDGDALTVRVSDGAERGFDLKFFKHGNR